MSKKNNFKVGDSVLYSQKRHTIVNYGKNIELDDGTGNITTLNKEKGLTKTLTKNEIEFARESIDEILEFASIALALKKSDSKKGKYYGVSITILIACAFDAIGRIGLDKNNKSADQNKDRFQFIQDEYVSKENYGFSNNEFVDIFYEIYRCGLVHSGTITPKHVISSDKNGKKVIAHGANGIATIYLDALIKMAKSIFSDFCTDYGISFSVSQFHNASVTGDTTDIVTKMSK